MNSTLVMKDILSQVSEDLGEFFRVCVTRTGQLYRRYLSSLPLFVPFSKITEPTFLQCFTYLNGECSQQFLEYIFNKCDNSLNRLKNCIEKMTAIGLLSCTQGDIFKIHPLLPVHLRRTLPDVTQNCIAGEFIAYFVEMIQKSNLDSLEAVQEIADATGVNLFTAYTIPVEKKNDLARGTLFNALAALHCSAIV